MIYHIPIDEILVSEFRNRKDTKAIESLVKDIEDKGLLHPIVLRADKKTLVAGEQRLRAMRIILEKGGQIRCAGQLLPPGHVPCTTTSDLSEYQAENTIRQDLSWQERVKALEELHELKKALNPAHTYADTARIVNQSTQEIREAVILARNLDDPAIANAKTQKEAIKIFSRKLEGEFISELARRKSSKITAHTLLRGDPFDLMRQLPPTTFDCILSDPPSDTCYRLLAREGFRVCRPEAHLYAFCDPFYFSLIHEIFTEAGWWVFRTPLIWAKGDSGVLPYPDHGPRRTYEAIAYAIKGARRTRGVYSDLIAVPNLRQKLHAAQKPVDLYVNLLSRSCSVGDKVLDPFAGSGTIFPAANLLKLVATGIEQDEATAEIAQARILSTGDTL